MGGTIFSGFRLVAAPPGLVDPRTGAGRLAARILVMLAPSRMAATYRETVNWMRTLHELGQCSVRAINPVQF